MVHYVQIFNCYSDRVVQGNIVNQAWYITYTSYNSLIFSNLFKQIFSLLLGFGLQDPEIVDVHKSMILNMIPWLYYKKRQINVNFMLYQNCIHFQS